MYWLADTGPLRIYRYWHMVRQYALILKLFFKAGKHAGTSDLKWCNYVVCGLLFNN